MLNPKLMEEFGEQSITFFNELVNNVDGEAINVCYAIVGSQVKSGDLCGPKRIGVLTADDNLIDDICGKCIDISISLKDKEDECSILCRRFTEDRIKKDGIKVWV